MRNFTKHNKARFGSDELNSAIEAVTHIAGEIKPASPGSRSSVIRVSRGGASVVRPVRSGVAVPVDPTVMAVKRTGSSRILGTDPHALDKLQMKLASLLALQENMERTNEFLANDDRAGLLRYGYSAEGIEELFLCGPGQLPGFSPQELANMALNVERTRDRIAVLTKSLARPSKVEHGRGYQYQEDADEQRVAFAFPQKPAQSVRQLLGQSGFRWSVTRAAWTRPMSDNSIAAASKVREALESIPDIFEKKTKVTLH